MYIIAYMYDVSQILINGGNNIVIYIPTVAPRASILHRQRVPGPAARAAPTRVRRQQLPDDVHSDGARSRHVRASSAPQPASGRRQTNAQFPSKFYKNAYINQFKKSVTIL